MPDMLYQIDKRLISVLRSMVSKAAEKSSKVSVVNELVGMLTVAY